MKRLSVFIICFLTFSCGEPKVTHPDLDLMSHGMPIKIKAPEGVTFDARDYGLMQDLTVKKDDNYYIQIFSSEAMILDAKKVKDEKLAEVKDNESFSKIIQEDDNGFIYEKTRSDSTMNYDFRHVRIQGDKQYIFQTGMIGKFSLEDVQNMYQSVQ